MMTKKQIVGWIAVIAVLCLAIGFAAGGGWALYHVQTVTAPAAQSAIDDSERWREIALQERAELVRATDALEQVTNELSSCSRSEVAAK